MARQPIILGVADAKTGDTPFAAATKINANETELYDDVATNAAAIVTNANAITANTALITGFSKTYWFDANDTATASTPISHTGGATGTYLTNDGIGSFTNAYNPDGNDVPWNPSTNKFNFTSLKIGDTVDIRVELTITNAAAQEIDIFMSLAEGTAGPYEVPMTHLYYKTAATGTSVIAILPMYMGADITRTGGARFRFSSAAAATIRVNGWYYKITSV